jgi:hypothetical protein
MSDNGYQRCKDCGLWVEWRVSKKGHRYLADRKEWMGSETFAQRAYYPRHACTPNPEAVAALAAEHEARIAAGEIVKGATVRVAKGRKVAIGTVGTVFWVATDPDAYGVLKVGFTTEGGEKHFINIANVEAVIGTDAK